jgi:DNA-binding cell septation regulator SpoVG
MDSGENKIKKRSKMRHFIIENLKNVDWGKTVATLSLVVLDEHQKPLVTVHDCKLVDGAKGFFVSAPSKKLDTPYTGKDGKQKEYMDLAFIHFDHRDELNSLAAEMYDPAGTTTKTLATADEELPF